MLLVNVPAQIKATNLVAIIIYSAIISIETESIMSGKHGAGKGDKYRQVDMKKYSENYDKIFPKKGKVTTKKKNGVKK